MGVVKTILLVAFVVVCVLAILLVLVHCDAGALYDRSAGYAG